MARKVQACAECTQKCLLLHGKKKNSYPIANSFFKVMIGNQFDKVLYFPPKFAPTMSALIGQETFLEDSNRQQWKVTVSNVDGSFGFKEGWNSFAVDHGLEVGDFVVFKYVRGSHFDVEIYDQTACGKLTFSVSKNQRKRARGYNNSTGNDGLYHPIDKGSRNKQCLIPSIPSGSDVEITQSPINFKDAGNIEMGTENGCNCDDSNRQPHPVSRSGYIEEQCYIMMNREWEDKQREDPKPLFNLFNYEMCRQNSGTDGSNEGIVGGERYPCRADSSRRSHLNAGLVDEHSVGGRVARRVVSFGYERTERNTYSEEFGRAVAVADKTSCDKMSRHLLATSAVKPVKVTDDHINGPIKRCLITEGGSKIHSKSSLKKEPVVASWKEHISLIGSNTGEGSKSIKVERGQRSNAIVRDNEKVQGVVKAEPIDFVTSPSVTDVSCSISTDSQSFLDLPSCLPLSFSKGNKAVQRKVVLLQDAIMRLWPVLYHDRLEFKGLTSGWEAFSKANCIQRGDKCIFGVESDGKSIVKVRIIHK